MCSVEATIFVCMLLGGLFQPKRVKLPEAKLSDSETAPQLCQYFNTVMDSRNVARERLGHAKKRQSPNSDGNRAEIPSGDVR